MEFKVLIVEDDEAVAQAAAVKLRGCGLEVKVINRGDEAIPTMKEWLPHVVVLDLNLPGKSGIEISQQMRLEPLLKNIIKISNSTHMEPDGSLGAFYYGESVQAEGQEPVMINKLKPTDGIFNDLTAAVGILIGEKYQTIPKKMGEYLEKIKKRGKEWG